MQMQEQNPVRGYYSSVDQDLIFGVGVNTKIDSVIAIWPDGKKDIRTNIVSDSTLVLTQSAASTMAQQTKNDLFYLFTDVTSTSEIQYRHMEYEFNDFALPAFAAAKIFATWSIYYQW